MDQRGAARLGEDTSAYANEAACWDKEVNTCATVGTVLNVLHARPALRHDPSNDANEVNRDVNRQLLKWLFNAVLCAMNQYLWT